MSWFSRNWTNLFPTIVIFLVGFAITWQVISAVSEMEITGKGRVAKVEGEYVEIWFQDSTGTFHFENEFPDYVVEGTWVEIRFTWDSLEILEFLGPTEEPTSSFWGLPTVLLFMILAIAVIVIVIIRILAPNAFEDEKNKPNNAISRRLVYKSPLVHWQ